MTLKHPIKEKTNKKNIFSNSASIVPSLAIICSLQLEVIRDYCQSLVFCRTLC